MPVRKEMKAIDSHISFSASSKNAELMSAANCAILGFEFQVNEKNKVGSNFVY